MVQKVELEVSAELNSFGDEPEYIRSWISAYHQNIPFECLWSNRVVVAQLPNGAKPLSNYKSLWWRITCIQMKSHEEVGNMFGTWAYRSNYKSCSRLAGVENLPQGVTKTLNEAMKRWEGCGRWRRSLPHGRGRGWAGGGRRAAAAAQARGMTTPVAHGPA